MSFPSDVKMYDLRFYCIISVLSIPTIYIFQIKLITSFINYRVRSRTCSERWFQKLNIGILTHTLLQF